LDEVISKLKAQVPTVTTGGDSLRKSRSLEVLKMEEMRLKLERDEKEKVLTELREQGTSKIVANLEHLIAEQVSRQRDLSNVLVSQTKVSSANVLRSTGSLQGAASRKVQSRPFNSPNSIRIISSSKV
jgi:hypothetical protein